MGTQQGGRPLNPTKTWSRSGEVVTADEVAGVPTALPDLSDVNNGVSPSKGSLLVGDGSEWIELPPAADDQALVYDSSAPTGFRTEPLASGGSGGTSLFGADSIGLSTTSRYLYPGYAERIAEIEPHFWISPLAGTLQRLHVRHSVPGVGGSIVYRVRVNEVATALVVTLAAGDTSASNIVDTAALSIGDRVDLQVVKTTGLSQSPRNVVVTMEIA